MTPGAETENIPIIRGSRTVREGIKEKEGSLMRTFLVERVLGKNR